MDFIYEYNIEGTNSLVFPVPASPGEVGNVSAAAAGLSDDFGTKFSSILSHLNKKSGPNTGSEGASSNDLANKFAKLSMDLIKQSERDATNIDMLSSSVETNKKTNIILEKLHKILKNPSVLSSAAFVDNSREENTIKACLHLLESRNFINLLAGVNRIDEDYNLIIQPGMIGTVARRKLKINILNESLKDNYYALQKFLPVYSSLKRLSMDVEHLNETNDRLLEEFGQLSDFNEKNFKHNDEFNLAALKKLKSEKDLILIKKHLLISFKKEFQLNEYERFLLSSSSEINKDFFASFDKANKIYKKCYFLLSMNNPQIGLDIMRQTKGLINQALSNMNFFIGQKLGQLGSLTRDEFNCLKKSISLILLSVTKDDLISTSMLDEPHKSSDAVELSEIISSNQLVKELVSNLIDNKRKSVVQEFERIVQEGQMYSSIHDPMRYVGDMLASVHSLIVGEKEVFGFLLNMEESSSVKEEHYLIDIVELQNYLLDNVIGVLANPLKLRLEQIIRSQSDISIISQLYESFDLYKLMFSKQLVLTSKKHSIISTISNLQSLLQERIFTILHNKQNQVSHEALSQPIDDSDLQTPDWLINYLNSIQDVLRAFSSTTSEKNFMNLSDELLEKLINLFIDKPIEFVDQQIGKSQLGTDCKSICKINSLDNIASKILTIDLLSHKYEQVNQLLMEESQRLIDITYNTLLAESGMTEIEKTINKLYPVKTFAEKEQQRSYNTDYKVYEDGVQGDSGVLALSSLQIVNTTLQHFIPDAVTHPIFFNLTQISSPMISNQIIESASLDFVNLYRVVHTLVVIHYNNLTDQEEKILTWNDIEIATLLGVEKAYMEQMNASLETGDDGDVISELDGVNEFDSDIEP